jgi:hypothetical protein
MNEYYAFKDGKSVNYSFNSKNFSRKTITDKELMSKYEEYLKTHNDNEGVADYFADEFNLKDDEVDELVDRLTEIIIPDNFNSPVRFSSYKLKNPRINY